MLGFDTYWERIDAAYRYEVRRRTRILEDEAANTPLEPGEIAHIDDDGTLSAGFYDFMEWQGMKLTRREEGIRAKLKLNVLRGNSFGRWCLVIQRLDDGRYIICYLTSFNSLKYGANLESLLGKLFAVAIDDTPEYPPGTPSIKMSPKWHGNGFLYAIPVPRENLRRHSISGRIMLRMGELERIKRLISERVQVRQFVCNATRNANLIE